MGRIARKTPRLVATPRPPLNRTQGEKTCPRIEAKPQASCPIGSDVRKAAAVPLAVSRMKTGMPHFGPRKRTALVAPMFPLPTVLRSIPRRRPAQRPQGMEPSRNPATTSSGLNGISKPSRTRVSGSVAPFPLQDHRSPLEPEPAAQSALQVTYIILGTISRIVHEKGE